MKVAVVGFGFMGMTHTMNILKNPNVDWLGIVDRNPDAVHQKLQEETGNFSTGSLSAEDISNLDIYPDLTTCINTAKPDVCIISVHTALHFEMAKTALEGGAHVFVEKPFTLNVDEAEQLIELAKSKNKILMVGHVVRFMPVYEQLKSWIDNETYGKLKFLSLSRFSGLPAWGQWKERQKDFGSSGGALFDLVIHDIDYAQWVCGVPDAIDSQIIGGKLSNYDYVSALWKYHNSDLIVKVDGGNTFHSEFPFQAALSAQFENASVHFSSKEPENIVVATDSETTFIPAGDAGEGFANEMNYFLECAKSNTLPKKCTPESALDSIRTCYRHISGI